LNIQQIEPLSDLAKKEICATFLRSKPKKRPMKNKTLFALLFSLLMLAPALHAEELFSLNAVDTPLSMLVEKYNEWTGRTLIIQANLKPQITLKYSKLTKKEAMQAIETVLAMNGVALVPMGEKFLKIVNIAGARQEGMAIEPFDPDKEYAAADQLITQVIPLRYVIYPDVEPIVQQLLHGYGKVVKMDRVNSILVTDTSANIARIVEVLQMVDQPLEKIEPRIYQLKYAQAGDVAGKLKELVEAAKTKKGEQSVIAPPRTVPGVIRAPRTTTAAVGDNAFADETQMIQGAVKFVSDERTNILIIFSKAANFDFFDRIIKVLDVPVDPEVVVEVVNLEYAEAKEISGILNEFVGAAKESEKTKAGSPGGADGSKSIDELFNSTQKGSSAHSISTAAKSAIGRLSADTKILSDERTNSLLLMGRRSDIEALKTVIATLDVMLEQVLIEAVILSVDLGDKYATGIEWVYDNTATLNPRKRWGTTVPSGITNALAAVADSTLSYYAAFPHLDLEALISAAKSDSHTRILSTPVVLTTDNTEAKITVARERPVITSSVNSDSSTTARSTYEYRTIGIDLTVTPHINPERFVLMEISQSADQIGKEIEIDKNFVPEVLKREISATVAVQDRSTVVLGGLIENTKTTGASKIPFLGDIPIFGWFFSRHADSDDRQELVVLLTPYVLTNPEEALLETERRLKSSDVSNTEWPHGWSESPLKNDEPAKDEWKTKHLKKKAAKAEAAQAAE